MRDKLISSYRVCGEFDLTDAILDYRIAAIEKIYKNEDHDFFVNSLAFFILDICSDEHKENLIVRLQTNVHYSHLSVLSFKLS